MPRLLTWTAGVVFLVTSTNAGTKVFYDKSEFLAQTGGVSASGPLPDVGLVLDASINPNDVYWVGSVGFGLLPESDNLAIGAIGTGAEPDWYDVLPGNDIALGWEAFSVDLASPVHALGFDMADPDATMPSFGGTPQDTTFLASLWSGGVQISTARFNVEDDVAAFAGLWSPTPFDRVEIRDLNLNDDDEFWGEFFTGDLPAPPSVPGDANGDGCVSGADYTIWADNFELWNGEATCMEGDFTGDGFVTGADYTVWADHFGEGCPPMAVPEGSSFWLTAVGAGLLLGQSLGSTKPRAATEPPRAILQRRGTRK